MGGFYKRKRWATGSFDEYILEDGYTPAEPANRCLCEYGKRPGG